MKMIKLFLAIYFTACTTPSENKIELNLAPQDDQVYFSALEKATRTANVFHDFETEYKVQVTLFSSDFKTALRERHKNILILDSSAFDEASSKLGFLISIFAPDSNMIELDNTSHWTILSSSGANQLLKPILLRKIEDKIRWKNYFHYINKWSQEWLVVFDAPSVSSDPGKLVEPLKTTLTLATGNAKMTFSW